MVLEAAVHTITSIGVARLLPWFAAAVGLYILRTWAKGFTCREERNLNNKTFVLIVSCSSFISPSSAVHSSSLPPAQGGFSGPGLSLFRSLASRGAQVIALHPTPSSPHILQLILLLRSSTSNERLYADECDMLDLASVRSFVKRWEKDARSGMVNDLEARIEGIIFCDGEGSGLDGNEGMGVGRILAQHPTNDELALERYHTALLLSRHALVQLLLPTILRSAANTPVRIINQISPFYAASALDLNDLDYVTRPYPDWEPWLVEGQASLGSIALFRELQLRVDEQRKPGSGGLVIVSVCGGFTRAWARRTLRANFDNERFSWIGFAVHLIAFPLIFWLMKSAEEASQGLLGAVLGNVRRRDVPDIVGEEKANEDEEKNRVLKGKARGKREEKVTVPLRGGAVYREGVEIR